MTRHNWGSNVMWPHDPLRSNQVSTLCGPTQHTQCLHAKFVPKGNVSVQPARQSFGGQHSCKWQNCHVMHTLLFVNQLRPWHTHARTHAHMQTHTYTHANTHMHTHMHTHMQTHARTHAQTCKHTCKHTCTHTCKHTHTHAHMQHSVQVGTNSTSCEVQPPAIKTHLSPTINVLLGSSWVLPENKNNVTCTLYDLWVNTSKWAVHRFTARFQLVLSCGHAVTEDMVAKDDWPSGDCVTTVRSFGCEAVCV